MTSVMQNSMTELRKGFTTGTCAQAAAKGAVTMLTRRKVIDTVEVITPSGVALNLKLIEQEIGDDFAKCAVIKDSGDDPDVTDGAKICVEVRFSDSPGISIKGGQGVGKVTKPGLAVAVGEWAINPIPRKMIEKEIFEILNSLLMDRRNFPVPLDYVGTRMSRLSRKFLQHKGFEVTISVPQGEELAKKTFNPNLGIVGGISIIGTTGIVEPKSLDAYKASLRVELDVLSAQGYKKAVLILGYVGEKFCKEYLRNDNSFTASVIKIGDHVGFMLQECAKKKVKEVLLIGHIGKLIKVTCGQFNTHCSFGDNRVETIARYAKLCGADNKIIDDVLAQPTAEATIEILRKAGFRKVFERMAKEVSAQSGKFVDNKIKVECILLSLKGEVLGSFKPENCRED